MKSASPRPRPEPGRQMSDSAPDALPGPSPAVNPKPPQNQRISRGRQSAGIPHGIHRGCFSEPRGKIPQVAGRLIRGAPPLRREPSPWPNSPQIIIPQLLRPRDFLCCFLMSPVWRASAHQNPDRTPGGPPGGTPAPEPVCPEPPEHAGMPGPGLSLYSVLRPPSHSGRQITGCLTLRPTRVRPCSCAS